MPTIQHIVNLNYVIYIEASDIECLLAEFTPILPHILAETLRYDFRLLRVLLTKVVVRREELLDANISLAALGEVGDAKTSVTKHLDYAILPILKKSAWL